MSRGRGHLQRWLLAELGHLTNPGDGETWGLARGYYGPAATDSERSSVRRALRRLEEDGLVASKRWTSLHGRPYEWRLTDKGRAINLGDRL
jgi:hypothetical protein